MRVLSALTGGLSLFVSQPLSEVRPATALEFISAFEVPRTLVGDWEPPQAVVMVYTDGWDETLSTLLTAISGRIPVLMLLEEGLTVEDASTALEQYGVAQAGRIVSTEVFVDSVWARDYAPIQVWDSDARLVWLDSPYDTERPLDDEIPRHLGRWSPTPTEELLHSIDGGAVASSGDKFCVSTIEYFMENEIDWRDEHELQPLLLQLGCKTMVLVPALVGEETKHVDVFLQFIEPDVVAISSYDRTTHPDDAERMDIAALAVQKAAKKMGKEMSVIRVPAPAPRGRDYPTYVNFLRLSDIALVPSYAGMRFSAELEAYEILQQAMPGVELVPIPSDVPVDYGGAVHCLTWGLQRNLESEARPTRVARRRGRAMQPLHSTGVATRRAAGG